MYKFSYDVYRVSGWFFKKLTFLREYRSKEAALEKVFSLKRQGIPAQVYEWDGLLKEYTKVV